ncbi:MAG: hypothetical protein WA711_21545, partial [Pseudolabrys sp.]
YTPTDYGCFNVFNASNFPPKMTHQNTAASFSFSALMSALYPRKRTCALQTQMSAYLDLLVS